MSQWNESQGGFNASQSPMGGKTPMTGGKSMADLSMIPVTVKLLTNAETSGDNSSKAINGRTLTTIKVCGRVTAIDSKATYTSYTIDDSTGMMEVRHWTDNDSGEPSTTDVKENDYVMVVGKVSLYQGNAQINCYNVIKCKSYNQVIHHLISVMFCNESNKKLAATSGGNTGGMNSNNTMNMGGGGTSAGAGAGAADDEAGLAEEMSQWNDVQRKVYMAIKERQSGHANGVHVPDLVNQIGVGANDLREALMFLTNEGMIYDTTSEDWVRTTGDS